MNEEVKECECGDECGDECECGHNHEEMTPEEHQYALEIARLEKEKKMRREEAERRRREPTVKIGRNNPCPCGSGEKFKKCCWGLIAKRQPMKAVK